MRTAVADVQLAVTNKRDDGSGADLRGDVEAFETEGEEKRPKNCMLGASAWTQAARLRTPPAPHRWFWPAPRQPGQRRR